MANPMAVWKQFKEAGYNPSGGLFEVLAARHIGSGVKNARVVSQEQVFFAFAKTGFDYVGQGSSAICSTGAKVGVNVGVDVGKAILPGFGKLSVDLAASGALLKDLLLILVRQATHEEDASASATLTRPTCFMALRGKTKEWAIEAGVAAGVRAGFSLSAGKGFDHNIKSVETVREEERRKKEEDDAKDTGQKITGALLEAVAIEAEAAVEVSAKAKYKGTYMYAADVHPKYYASIGDAELRARFSEYVGVGTKSAIKERIKLMFKQEKALTRYLKSSPWYVDLQKAITASNVAFDDLIAGFGEIRVFLDQLDAEPARCASDLAALVKVYEGKVNAFLGKSWFSRHNDAEKAKLKADIEELFAREKLLVPYKPVARGIGSSVKLERWKEALGAAASVAQFWGDVTKRNELRQEIEHHLEVIRQYRALGEGGSSSARSSATVEPEEPSMREKLCFLSMWGHSPGVEAAAEAKVEVSALKVLSAGAKAGLSASKSMKWTHYRYQQFRMTSGGATSTTLPYVVCTQDTAIKYSQTVLKADASASAMGKRVSAEKVGVINSMSYESATVFWKVPVVVADSKTGKRAGATVDLLPGSGFAFGQSVVLKTLVENFQAYERKKTDLEAAKYLATVADKLHVRLDDLLVALRKSWICEGQSLQDLAIKERAEDNHDDAILLEATFRSSLPTAQVDFSDVAPELDPEVRAKMLKAATTPALESIRFRYRIADTLEASTGFKLGVPGFGIVKLGIQLEAVSRAGATGIVDLDIHWFGKTKEISAPYEGTMPCTMLFHQ